MRDEKEGRKKQARSNKQQDKATSTPKAVTFPKKNELLQVGLKPMTLDIHVGVECENRRQTVDPAVTHRWSDLPTVQ